MILPGREKQRISMIPNTELEPVALCCRRDHCKGPPNVAKICAPKGKSHQEQQNCEAQRISSEYLGQPSYECQRSVRQSATSQQSTEEPKCARWTKTRHQASAEVRRPYKAPLRMCRDSAMTQCAIDSATSVPEQQARQSRHSSTKANSYQKPSV